MPLGSISGLGVGQAIGGIGSLVGGGKSSKAASQAADVQAQAAQAALKLQAAMFDVTQKNLAPFIQGGATTFQTLQSQLPTLTAPFQPTMAQLAATPGYQFTLQQGLQGVTNAYAPSGLAGNVIGRQAMPSGPLAAAQTQYASGLASQTFNQQFQNYLAQNQQIANIYGASSQLGEAAAAGQGVIGANVANSQSSALLGGAAAQAAGIVGSANALNQGLAGFGGSIGNIALLNALQNSGMFGGQTGGASLAAPTGFATDTNQPIANYLQ